MAQDAGTVSSGPHVDRQWFIVGRWQEFAGEARANLLRIIAVGAFYIVELANYYGVDFGPIHLPKTVERDFHVTATALAVAWVLVALATQLCLTQGIFPAALKFVTTACDIVLLTATLCIGDGPQSPLLVGYFLILAVAALRFRLRLIWFATALSVAGYFWVLGYAAWYSPRPITVPRYYEVIFVLALALNGIVLGQAIRRVRAIAEEFAQRTGRSGGLSSQG